jgi:hypothetical protein
VIVLTIAQCFIYDDNAATALDTDVDVGYLHLRDRVSGDGLLQAGHPHQLLLSKLASDRARRLETVSFARVSVQMVRPDPRFPRQQHLALKVHIFCGYLPVLAVLARCSLLLCCVEGVFCFILRHETDAPRTADWHAPVAGHRSLHVTEIPHGFLRQGRRRAYRSLC